MKCLNGIPFESFNADTNVTMLLSSTKRKKKKKSDRFLSFFPTHPLQKDSPSGILDDVMEASSPGNGGHDRGFLSKT